MQLKLPPPLTRGQAKMGLKVSTINNPKPRRKIPVAPKLQLAYVLPKARIHHIWGGFHADIDVQHVQVLTINVRKSH